MQLHPEMHRAPDASVRWPYAIVDNPPAAPLSYRADSTSVLFSDPGFFPGVGELLEI